MTASDWERLIHYRNKRGPLNPMLRMEAGFALVASCVLNSAGMKKESGGGFAPADFMPWASDRKVMTVDDMILEWARSGADG